MTVRAKLTAAVDRSASDSSARLIDFPKSDPLSVAAHDLAQPALSLRVYIMSLRRSIEAGTRGRTEIAKLCDSLDECAKAIHWTIEKMADQAAHRELYSDLADDSPLVPSSQVLDEVRVVVKPVASALQVEYREFVGQRSGCLTSRGAAAMLSVLTNLITNSIKYKAPIRERRPVVLVSMVVTSKRIIWDVVDNGIGMSKRELSSAFMYGWRGQTNEASEGRGLGLSSVLDSLGAIPDHRLVVASEKGRGTRFRVTVPRLSPANRPAARHGKPGL